MLIGRSKYKIPRMAEGNYQYVIQGVYGINAMGGSGKKLKGQLLIDILIY
jgi:hypothetical protein